MSNKREFDRHSGSNKTGVKAVDKREGGGAHNWGSVQDEAEAAIEEIHGGRAATEAKDEDQNAPQQEAGAGKEMTLEEYMKKEEAKRLHPHYDTRKPNEDVKN